MKTEGGISKLMQLHTIPEAIPKDIPYSIIICESIFPHPYRVEIYDYRDNVNVLVCGELTQCDTYFDQLKSLLIAAGNTVHEVGCGVSKQQVPRQMLVNCPPLVVWKRIYNNLKTQALVRQTDRILSALRDNRVLTSDGRRFRSQTSIEIENA